MQHAISRPAGLWSPTTRKIKTNDYTGQLRARSFSADHYGSHEELEPDHIPVTYKGAIQARESPCWATTNKEIEDRDRIRHSVRARR